LISKIGNIKQSLKKTAYFPPSYKRCAIGAKSKDAAALLNDDKKEMTIRFDYKV